MAQNVFVKEVCFSFPPEEFHLIALNGFVPTPIVQHGMSFL